jgi:hypothetical protein
MGAQIRGSDGPVLCEVEHGSAVRIPPGVVYSWRPSDAVLQVLLGGLLVTYVPPSLTLCCTRLFFPAAAAVVHDPSFHARPTATSQMKASCCAHAIIAKAVRYPSLLCNSSCCVYACIANAVRSLLSLLHKTPPFTPADQRRQQK